MLVVAVDANIILEFQTHYDSFFEIHVDLIPVFLLASQPYWRRFDRIKFISLKIKELNLASVQKIMYERGGFLMKLGVVRGDQKRIIENRDELLKERALMESYLAADA